MLLNYFLSPPFVLKLPVIFEENFPKLSAKESIDEWIDNWVAIANPQDDAIEPIRSVEFQETS